MTRTAKQDAGSSRFGIGVPQANPTVEQEAFALKPKECAIVISRLTSESVEARRRLLDYVDNIPNCVSHFGGMHIDAFGFACTGSSYLLGASNEAKRIATLERKLDLRIVTAASAIVAQLQELGSKRIAIVAPYPAWLVEKALEYWKSHRLEITEVARVPLPGDDTYGIYGLTADQALKRLRKMRVDRADAVLFSGTGMPTLDILREAEAFAGCPALSSNLCLIRTLCRSAADGQG